jgi:hypothetical protein
VLEEARALVALQETSYANASAGIRASWPQSSAMGTERLAAFLDQHPYCVLATTRPDGRPQARPFAFTVQDGAFWIASIAGARLRNLGTRPYASLVVAVGGRGTHRMLLVDGPVRIHDRQALATRLDPIWRERHGSAPTWATAFVELRPERLFSYDEAG